MNEINELTEKAINQIKHLDKNDRWLPKSKGSITISTTISPQLWHDGKKYGVSWSEALRVGMTFILSQITDAEYKNPLQYERKIQQLAVKLEEFSREKNELEKELKKYSKS